MKIKTAVIFFIVCISISYSSQLTAKQNQNQTIQNTLNSLVSENYLPGLNFSIIYKDGEQENYSAGLADVERGINMDGDKVMFTGSIGKTFAVTLLMQLVDEGKVELNKKFIEYFPNTEWLKNIPNINDFTVLMLLQHSSGLPRYVNHMEVWETTRDNPDKVWSYEDRLSHIYNDEPVNEAGKEWNYSDTGYLLIGMLDEKFFGDYYTNVKERVLIPQTLSETYGAITRDLPNLAVGYSKFPEFLTPEITVVEGRYYFNPQMEWTGGGFASTTSDLAKWAKLYYDGELFSDSLKQKIVTPKFETGENEKYGAGSFIFNTKHGLAYGHTGLMPGYRSIFIYFPEKEIACALQMNCDYGTSKISLIEYVERIMESILN